MPAWLLPAISAVSSVAGSMMSNSAARRQSEKQMAFQERMSSTAAQRSVRDYTLAGLNPGLAYDRPASSPGGSMAPQSDVLGPGVSSAMAAANMRRQLELVGEQTRKVAAERKSAELSAGIAQDTYDERLKTEFLRLRQEQNMFTPTLQMLQKQLQMMDYNMSEAKNWSELQKKMGIWGNLLHFIKPR